MEPVDQNGHLGHWWISKLVKFFCSTTPMYRVGTSLSPCLCSKKCLARALTSVSPTLWLLCTGTCSCGISYITSDDDGVTWSAPQQIPSESCVVGSSLASGITTRNGTLVGCLRKICRNSCPADYHSKLYFSRDRGQTWTASAEMAAGTTECQIAEVIC